MRRSRLAIHLVRLEETHEIWGRGDQAAVRVHRFEVKGAIGCGHEFTAVQVNYGVHPEFSYSVR